MIYACSFIYHSDDGCHVSCLNTDN